MAISLNPQYNRKIPQLNILQQAKLKTIEMSSYRLSNILWTS